MGLLDNFERGLEKAVNGAFARTFRSGLQPVEIIAALKNEADRNVQVVSRDRILVPNLYRVSINPDDYRRLAGAPALLTDELTTALNEHARRQHYAFPGPLTITISEDASVALGLSRIDSRSVDADTVSWTPAVEVGGKLYPITKERTVIGRSSVADIVIEDPGVSKKHLAIIWNTRTAVAKDLGSTNGTTFAGERIQEVELLPDTSVRIGRTAVKFRLVPRGQFGGAQ